LFQAPKGVCGKLDRFRLSINFNAKTHDIWFPGTMQPVNSFNFDSKEAE